MYRQVLGSADAFPILHIIIVGMSSCPLVRTASLVFYRNYTVYSVCMSIKVSLLTPSTLATKKTKSTRQTKAVRLYTAKKPDSALVDRLAKIEPARLRVLVELWDERVYFGLSLWHHFSSVIWRNEVKALASAYRSRTSHRVWLPSSLVITDDVIQAVHWCGLVGESNFLADTLPGVNVSRLSTGIIDGTLVYIVCAVALAVGEIEKAPSVHTLLNADFQKHLEDERTENRTKAMAELIEGFSTLKRVEAGEEAA